MSETSHASIDRSYMRAARQEPTGLMRLPPSIIDDDGEIARQDVVVDYGLENEGIMLAQFRIVYFGNLQLLEEEARRYVELQLTSTIGK